MGDMNVKKEIEQAAIITLQCPSCGAEPGKNCYKVGAGSLGKLYKVKTHQRRLSAFVAGHIKEKL